jgi:hypothetical protein
MSKHNIDDPLERAATKGVIGGGKSAKPVIAKTTTDQATSGESSRGEKRNRKAQLVYLPPELIKYLKYQAVDRELEISQIAEEAIREHRDRHQE